MSEILKITARNLIEHPKKIGRFAIVTEIKPGHEGEKAFPGGAGKRGETPWEAAWRETIEEVGLTTTATGLIRLPPVESEPNHHRFLFTSTIDPGQKERLQNPAGELTTEFLSLDEIIALEGLGMLRHPTMPEDIKKYQNEPRIDFSALYVYMRAQDTAAVELAGV